MTHESDRPLVSVVTPVLNRAETIGSCLASVASQTYPNIEQIVVDGGSTDDTLQIVKSFDSPHPLRWISEPDDGMYDAINKGLQMATGDVLAYLNSDDLYLPWSVTVGVERLAGAADLVFGDLGVLTATAPPSFYLQFYPEFDLAYYTHLATLGQPTVFWHRALTEKIGEFDTSYRLLGDCEYWLRAGASGAKIEHVDEILAIQVEHPGTLRVTQSVRLDDELRRVRAEYSGHSGHPRFLVFQKLKKSTFWRRRLLSFRRALRQQQPERWGRFIAFLRARNLEPDARAMSVLPARLRPTGSRWGNATDLSDAFTLRT